MIFLKFFLNITNRMTYKASVASALLRNATFPTISKELLGVQLQL
jgi:hypothetical protein